MLLHTGNGFLPDDGLAVGRGSVHRDDIRPLQQFFQRHIAHPDLGFQTGHREHVIGQHLHAQRPGHAAQFLTDAAEADDAQGLAEDLHAVGKGFLFPFVLLHGVSRRGNKPAAGENMRHGQFGHRPGGGPGGVADGDAVFLGVVHVDVVHAHAAPDDELQIRVFGLIDVTRSHLCGRAHHQRVVLRHGGTQIFAGIVLL